MNIGLGRKIRELRKARKISQEILAQYLGVSFQAVSKWENEATMPDVALIPAIASFFKVSTDELFDYNRLEVERRVEEITMEAARIREDQPEQAEQLLKKGLQQYPGNETLLNNLLYALRLPQQQEEAASICCTLIECAEADEIRFDAMRILAEIYHEMGETALVEKTLDRLPELYFTKLECAASLLEGDKSLEAARKQMHLSAEQTVKMLMIMGRRLREQGENEAAQQYEGVARGVLDSFRRTEEESFRQRVYERFFQK